MKKTSAPSTESLTLRYRLAELPTSQHRAGLAGLVLFGKWLARQPENSGTFEITDVDAAGATLHLDAAGLESAIRHYYAASDEEVEVTKPWKDAPVIRQGTRTTVHPKTGKEQTQTTYVHLQLTPRGGFVLDHDPTREGDRGAWTKLWRDFTWAILRGVPAQRRPYEQIAAKEEFGEPARTWADLNRPESDLLDLPSTYFLGAQAFTADAVPFDDRPRQRFLLLFWPFAASISVPVREEDDGSLEHDGFAVSVPDVASLADFCSELPAALRARSPVLGGFRPREALVNVPAESGLEFLVRLKGQLEVRHGRSLLSDLVLGIDVFHVRKDGNNVRVLGTSRVEPRVAMVDEYARIREACWDAAFRRQRVLNLLAGRVWYAGFEGLFETLPAKRFLISQKFGHDTRLAFDEQRSGGTMNETKEEVTSLESLALRVAEIYLASKLSTKHGLAWESVKDDPRRKGDYQEKREKIATDAFLAIRSRTSPADFVDYVASTLFSAPQHMQREDFLSFSKALRERPEDVRTLLLLALSARA